MIASWKSLAPLNNVAGVGFDAEYAREIHFHSTGSVDLDANYKGKTGSIRWQDVEASGDQGEVDLAATHKKEKGAVCYLFAEFNSSEARPAEARLGCTNANKVWINGKPVTASGFSPSSAAMTLFVYRPKAICSGIGDSVTITPKRATISAWHRRPWS